MKVNIFWFRRDLRLDDNTALKNALSEGIPVLPLFIFDTNITEELVADDARRSFIHNKLSSINENLKKNESSVLVIQGDPEIIWRTLIKSYDIKSVFINKDYEPYSISRDNEVERILGSKNIQLRRFKDQVIFEEKEVVKPDNTPYTIFTPYRNQWLKKFMRETRLVPPFIQSRNYFKSIFHFPSLTELGFKKSLLKVPEYDLSAIKDYDKFRDFPAIDKTTRLGPHLRFGTVSIRRVMQQAIAENAIFTGELIWREFFMQILFNFPGVVTANFRTKYNNIEWRNNDKEFEKWCNGETGYPLVDAGMRQLNETGYMHNRVRMIAAGFLCKHLLTDWRRGEAYFASKLIDYELSSNNGNWQWVAGTGCDAAQYFRIFNPDSQLRKFDSKMEYVSRWLGDSGHIEPIVDHDFARRRVIEAYRSALI